VLGVGLVDEGQPLVQEIELRLVFV
jgi:hypothetical protein